MTPERDPISRGGGLGSRNIFLLYLAASLSIAIVSASAAIEDFKPVVKTFGPSVGSVLVNLGEGRQAIGSGYLVTQNGRFITNAHVIQNAKSVYVRFGSGRSFRSKLLVADQEHDLAAIQLENFDEKLAPLNFPYNATANPEPLDEILIIGSPEGFASTAHPGTFSNVVSSQEIREPDGRRVFPKNFPVYQFNVDAAHGSSGGPVLDRNGRVIGTMAAGLQNGSLGISFGIPHALVRRLLIGGTPKPFGNDESSFELGAISETKLRYRSDHGSVSSPEGVDLNYEASQWGFIDPNFISQYLDDQAKTEQLVPGHLFLELARRNRLLHVVNSVFRYRVVVPEKFRLQETFDRSRGIYRATFTHPLTPEPVEIRVKQIARPEQMNLVNTLERESMDFLMQELHLQIIPPGYPLQNASQAYPGPLSDYQPRLGFPGNVKFWRQYFKHPYERTGYFMLFGIHQNLFYAVTMKYDPSLTGGPLPEEFVERLFLAATVSYIE